MVRGEGSGDVGAGQDEVRDVIVRDASCENFVRQPATADALGEMVLGFGLPTSGRALVDGINLIDLDPMSVRRQSLLVNEHGPLLDGTVEENLWSGRPKDAMIDVMDLARNACVSESILNLPDGLGTVLSSNDDRLAPDQLYRFGIVRALLKKPSVIVCHEPRMRVSAKDEAESLQALQQLVQGPCHECGDGKQS